MAVLTGRVEWIAVAAAPYALYIDGILSIHPVDSARVAYAIAAVLGVGMTVARALRNQHPSTTSPTVDEPLDGYARIPL